MTIKPIFSIFDSVAGFYSPTFQAENDAHAQRMFEQSIDLNHKNDFSLWRLGVFNSDNGLIVALKSADLVIEGRSVESYDIKSLKGKDQ